MPDPWETITITRPARSNLQSILPYPIVRTFVHAAALKIVWDPAEVKMKRFCGRDIGFKLQRLRARVY
jgi:hypothetical protein